MGLRLVVLLLCLSNNVLAINYLRHRFKEAMAVKSGTPASQCKVTGTSERNKDWNGAADVDLYYRSIVNLLAHHQTLRNNDVKPEHIIPGSGSGAFFYGCSHPHLESEAVMINDIDGICKGAECDAAFEAAYTKLESDNKAAKKQAQREGYRGHEFQNSGQFYVWPLDRRDDGFIMDMEVFNAAKEKVKTGDFDKGKDHYWKSGMLDMYNTEGGVVPTPLATKQKFCEPNSGAKKKKIAQYACPLCRVDQGKCTAKDSAGNGVFTGQFDITGATWCKDNCEAKLAAVSVPDCPSVCKFKRVMLNGEDQQRKKDGGIKKLTQDLADLRCLMKNCKLDKLCKPTTDTAKMDLTDLKGVGYGPKNQDADGLTDNDPPAMAKLAPLLTGAVVTTVQCSALLGDNIKSNDATKTIALGQST